MAADPLAAERAHAWIKKALRDGRFRLGERLDALKLADELGVSATPIREALARLSFERLVRLEPKRGYFARLWSEEELRALYDWRGSVAQMALASGYGATAAAGAGAGYAARVRAWLEMLSVGANPELKFAAANADDRLERARDAEPRVLANTEIEFERLTGAVKLGPRPLASALRSYHTRRSRSAADIRAAAVLAAVGANGDRT